MPSVITETESLSSFANNPQSFLARLRQSGEPILLTDNGEDQIVVQDAASYQQFLERMERLETIAAVRESMQDVAAGRTQPLREALAELAAKHQLPPV